MSSLSATVVVPVRNGAAALAETLPALAAQELSGGLELLAVDSGSTDGSLELLSRYGVRTLRWDGGAFDHGRARTQGAREARGRCVVFLSQDAVPADPRLVERLTSRLLDDARLAGAFARQLPRPEADPLTRRDLAGWPACADQARTVFLDALPGFDAMPPLDRYRLSVFDNVASAVPRERLLQHPFAPTRFGEDLEWGQRMLGLGFGLAYVPEALVIHSHPRSARALFRRNYLGHRLLARLFGLRSVPDRGHVLRAAAASVAADLGTLARARAGPGAFLAAPGQALAAVWGQYRGGRDEALGRAYPAWA